jgi:hypothetical protein
MTEHRQSTIARPEVIRFRVSTKERVAFKEAAQKEMGAPLGDWIRWKLREATMAVARATGKVVDL